MNVNWSLLGFRLPLKPLLSLWNDDTRAKYQPSSCMHNGTVKTISDIWALLSITKLLDITDKTKAFYCLRPLRTMWIYVTTIPPEGRDSTSRLVTEKKKILHWDFSYVQLNAILSNTRDNKNIALTFSWYKETMMQLIINSIQELPWSNI